MPDDSQYYYKISSDGSDTLSVKIKKAANKGGEKIPEDAMWCDYGYSEEEEKPTEESIGLSLDEAKKLVKEKVEKMGTVHFVINKLIIDFVLCTKVLKAIIVQVILEMDIELIMHVP